MAAPTSPKEPRRSNRRSGNSSSSGSKSSGSPSPDATAVPLPTKEPEAQSSSRSAASMSSQSSRSKKAKEETNEDSRSVSAPSHRRTTSQTSISPSLVSAPKRAKRRKEVVVQVEEPPEVATIEPIDEAQETPADGQEEEEEAGITRCVCDGAGPDDDGDAAEFMIQCEICKVWQHGPCMGFATEDDIPQGDYYCEQCKPEDHADLLKRLQRKQRQTSEKALAASRVSRSHSPSHFSKPSKRRNTMNSRDAAYEESLRELLDATAADAEAGTDTASKDATGPNLAGDDNVEENAVTIPKEKKKRKRPESPVDTIPPKRKRSASSASEKLINATSAVPESVGAPSPGPSTAYLPEHVPPPMPAGGKSRVRRGGGRKNVPLNEPGVEGDDNSSVSKKHPNQYTYRGKVTGGSQQRRPPASNSQSNGQGSGHEHGTRRNANASNGMFGTSGGAGTSGGPGSSRGGHHYQQYYNATQLPMFSSWGLPDYLAHLQSILPCDVPPPLNIRGATSFFREELGTAAGSSETPQEESEARNVEGLSSAPADSEQQSATVTSSATFVTNHLANQMAGATGALEERGVRVKWPAKRMSVADMNKRVRALVEWVGREQALAVDRERRKTSLETALVANLGIPLQPLSTETKRKEAKDAMEVDSDSPVGGNTASSTSNTVMTTSETVVQSKTEGQEVIQSITQTTNTNILAGIPSGISTVKMMEELMEELINFQERFGPGAKMPKERVNRAVVIS